MVRVSSIRETDPVDAPPPSSLNCVVLGYTSLSPEALLHELQRIETHLGRRRPIEHAATLAEIGELLRQRLPRTESPAAELDVGAGLLDG